MTLDLASAEWDACIHAPVQWFSGENIGAIEWDTKWQLCRIKLLQLLLHTSWSSAFGIKSAQLIFEVRSMVFLHCSPILHVVGEQGPARGFEVGLEGKKVAWVVASGKLASWQQSGQDGWWRLIPHTSQACLTSLPKSCRSGLGWAGTSFGGCFALFLSLYTYSLVAF